RNCWGFEQLHLHYSSRLLKKHNTKKEVNQVWHDLWKVNVLCRNIFIGYCFETRTFQGAGFF
mgnify:CR=1